MFFSRVDIEEKKYMRKNKRKTTVWRPHEEHHGKTKDILSLTMDQNKVLGNYCWPQGFWADLNYNVDIPMILNKNNKGYKFDKLVKSFYQDIVKSFEQERTNHIFKPFGCDFAFIDAKINYRIMDELLRVWNELGFSNDIELKYSTPTKFVNAMTEYNNKN